MAPKQQYRSLTHTPELGLSDTEDSYSSEEEMPDRDETNQLLRQAHHYVITEGGKDSPTTYMERIHRINESLIEEISTHNYDCDPKLFRRVKQKIDHVLREFEDVVDADSSLYDSSDSLELYTIVAEEGLYRTDSSPVTPDDQATRRTARIGGETDAERTYLYGGRSNHPESWYRKAEASLPFPEIIRMADWESLRIDCDLVNTGNMEKTEPVTGNAVSYNDSRFGNHDQLPRHESGSRFRLPEFSLEIMTKVNEFGTTDQLRKAVDAFHHGDDSKKDNGDYKYAPRVFLEKLDIGQQDSPVDIIDQVRKAINSTPTRSPASNKGNGKSNVTPPTTLALPDLSRRNLPSGPAGAGSSPTLVDHKHLVTHGSPAGEDTQSQCSATSSAIRRIRAAMEDSHRSSNIPQSPPAQWETKVATHISIPVKTRGARKDVTSVATMSVHQTTVTGKRKRLRAEPIEDQTEGDLHYQAVVSQRRRLARDSIRPCTPTMPTYPEDLDTPATLPALTPSSSVMSTPPIVKARAAGKKQRKIRTKHDFEQRVTPGKYNEIMASRKSGASAAGHESIARGSTRSGRVRML